MKKMLFFLIMLVSSMLVANPIIPGPQFQELYWSGNDWSLVFQMNSDEGNLDNYSISSNNGISHFVSDYIVEPDEIFIISNLDLETPLEINIQSDVLTTLITMEEDQYECDSFAFDPDGSWYEMVDFPTSGSSIRWINYLQWDGFAYSENRVHLATDVNSPYFNEGESQCQGVLSGYIYDDLNNPVENANVKFFKNNSSAQTYFSPITSDENGYYECQLYAKRYLVTAFYQERAFADTLLTINPNETTCCDFYLELSETEEEEIPKNTIKLKNIPNPFNPETVISYEIPHNYQVNEAHIEIFNSRGQKIIRMPVKNQSGEIIWKASNQASGPYFYRLILDGEDVEQQKMILLK